MKLPPFLPFESVLCLHQTGAVCFVFISAARRVVKLQDPLTMLNTQL